MVHHLWCHYLMESDITNTSSEIADQNPMVIDGIPSPMLAGALAQSNTLGQSQIMAGYHLLSTLQGEHINDLQVDLPIRSHGEVIGADASVCRNMPLCREAVRDDSVNSSRSISNNEFQEQFMGGASPPATSLPTRLETSSTMHENLNRVTIAASSAFPLDDLRTYVSNSCCDASMPFCFFGSSEPPGWVSSNKSNSSAVNPYGYCMPSNELSLSLATCQPSIISVPSIPDQCSEISCSAVTQHSLHGVGLGMGLCSEQTSSRSKELSLGSGSFENLCFSNILSGSKYLHVAQQILTEIASYSFENLHHISYSLGGIGTGAKMSFSSNCSTEKESSVMESDEFPFSAGKNRSEDQMKPTLQRQEVEAKKDQLLALLQVVNNRYNRCLDEIHTVISAFHAATELDPQIHARFVLQTISLLYNNLRERITKQILEIGECLSNGCMREGKSFESSSIQKQWALQQLRGKDHQPWRPQRGLPERSVSVLRAWMYQNFLHPYPKDTEKHLLAIKSGLTRSQVSNWFINARVRLWKPMIEEMYSEMNNRKGRRTEDRTNSDCRSHIIIDDQIIQMN